MKKNILKPLTIMEQYSHLKQTFPGFKCTAKCGELRISGQISPTTISSTYTFTLNYRLQSRPRVRIIEPKLEKPGGRNPPHLLSDGSLCLYYPKHYEWKPTMLIGETIIPWTSLWLFYYEVWLATGTWFGKGVHPTSNKKRDRTPLKTKAFRTIRPGRFS
ncbi:MAG: hypothetical protein ABRQ36_06660 [Mesotoga sp.]